MALPPNSTPAAPGTGLTQPRNRAREIPRPQPLGGNGQSGATLMQGLDGVVTSAVAGQQVAQEVAQDTLMMAERTSVMMGNLMDRAATMMGMGVGHTPGAGLPAWAAYSQAGMLNPAGIGMPMVPAGIGGSATFMPGALPGTATQFHGFGAPPPSSAVPAMPGTSAASGTPTSNTPAPVNLPGRGSGNTEGAVPSSAVPRPSGPRWPRNFEEGEQFVTNDEMQGFTLGGIRQNAVRSINRRVSEWGGSSEQMLVDDLGYPIRIDGKYQTRAVPRGTPTTALGTVDLADDGTMVADLAEGYVPSWQEGLLGNARNIAGNMAEGAGLGEAVSSAVPAIGKAAGIAGAAYTAVNSGLNFAESQRSKNQEFQAMIGGANSEGFGERWRQNIFRLGLRGTMSGADAEAIYKGAVSQYGNQAEPRRMYQDAAVGLYRGVGLSGQEASGMLDQAAGAGNDSLYAFADAITEVSRAARDAGESAIDARKNFQESFAQAETFSNGKVSISAATNASVTKSMMGDQFADVDASGINSEINLRRMADLGGYDYSEFSAELGRGGNKGALMLAGGQSALLTETMANIDSSGVMWSDAQKRVADAKKANGGELSQQALRNIAADVQIEYGVDPIQFTGAAENLAGIPIPEDDALAYLLSVPDPLTMEQERQGKIAEAESAVNYSSLGGPSLPGGKSTAYDKEHQKIVDRLLKETPEMDPVYAASRATKQMDRRAKTDRAALSKRLAKDFGKGAGFDVDSKGFQDNMKDGDFGRGKNSREFIRNQILEDASQGTYNPLATQFWKEYDQFKGAKFEVDTPDGKRAVDAKGLIANYSDQLQNDPSAIKIIGGDHGGESVGDVLGSDKTGKGNKGTASAKDAEASYGTESTGKAKGKVSGTVTISPTPELLRILNFTPTGAAELAFSRGEAPGASTEIPWGERTDAQGGN